MPIVEQIETTKYKTALKFYYLLVAIALLVSIYKDASNAIPMPSDVRNRLVGARMMKDGLSPYFYIWSEGGPTRYYDHVYPDAKISLATASPFFHYMFSSVADLPQFQMDIFWMFLQYFALGGTCLLAIISVPLLQRFKIMPLLIGLSVLFTYTIGWRHHIFNGQNYIFIPFLAMCCFYFIKREKNWLNIFGFSIFAAALILYRPVTLLLFLPFILYLTTYFRWGISVAGVIFAYAVFVFSNPIQKLNWSEYFKSLPIQSADHLKFAALKDSPSNKTPIKKGIYLTNFEGVDITTGLGVQKSAAFSLRTECSNLYIIYNKITGRWLSQGTLGIIGFILVALLMLPALVAIRKNIKLPAIALFVLGFVLYEIFTFCLPITRQQYNSVEYLFPLLLLPVWLKKFYIVPFFILAIGLYFNIADVPMIKMRHNIGGFLMLFSFLFFVYKPVLFFTKPLKYKLDKRFYWL